MNHQLSHSLDPQSKQVILWILSIAIFMEMLDSTIINTALPQISHYLNINPITLKTAITVYLFTLGIFIPVSGWLSDRLGERRVLMAAIIIFLISSLACGFAQNIQMLIVGRFFQGVGGAFLAPVGRIILVKLFHKEERIQAMAKITIPSLVGLMLGPITGGAITTYFGWRWIFLINVPVGLFGLVCIYRYLPRLSPPLIRRFDFIGFISLGGAIGSLLYFLETLQAPNFTTTMHCMLFLAFVMFSTISVIHIKKARNVLVDFSVFRSRTFFLVASASLISRLALSTPAFLIPLMLQSGYGASALHAGLFSIALSLGALSSRRLITLMLERFGARQLLCVNAALLFIISLSYSLHTFVLVSWMLAVQMMLWGFISALQITVMSSLVYGELSPDKMSSGVSIYSVIIQVAAAFGIAIVALIMGYVMGVHMTTDMSLDVSLQAIRAAFMWQSLFFIVTFILFLPIHQK